MLDAVYRPTLVPESPGNRLKAFGGALVETSTGPASGRAAQRHRIALLAMLATTRRLFRSRDQLIFMLWPDTDTERGRKLLSDSIYRINRALGGDVIVGGGEDLRLNRSQLSSDVADLEAAADARDWRRVMELYAGPFLDGFFLPDAADFDRWMEQERAQYARVAARACEALATEARDAGRVADAVDWWSQLAALVPDDSRVAMELMRALEASGNRAAAVRHAQAHANLLHDSLGVPPDRAVQHLADEIAERSCFPGNPTVAPEDSARGDLRLVITDTGQQADFGPSIAVLPFKNISASDDYFADGMSEELMHLLTRAPGLRVASPTSAFAYREAKLDVREVARRLNVTWIVEGSVRRAGDKVRVVAQLTDARNGYQAWSSSFNRTLNDAFVIQSEIAAAIVGQLAHAVGAAPVLLASPVAAEGATDSESYDLYLQARFQWHRRSELSLRESARLFEQVVARSPNYARAWAGLADAYAAIAFHDYLAPQVAFPRAAAAARRARDLDPTQASPHATLAFVDTLYHWNWEAAERGFGRALELEPNNSTAHQWQAHLLVARGEFEEADRAIRRAAEVEPLSIIASASRAWVYLLADEAERAVLHLNGVLQLDPTFQLGIFWLGLAQARLGCIAEALESLELVREPSAGCPQVLSALARVHALAGHTGTARTMLAELIERERLGSYVSSYDMAKAYLLLGDMPAALARLERSFEERAHSMAFVGVDPELAAFAGDRRFEALASSFHTRGRRSGLRAS